MCLCLHAEENALLEAGRERIGVDSILYCNTSVQIACRSSRPKLMRRPLAPLTDALASTVQSRSCAPLLTSPFS